MPPKFRPATQARKFCEDTPEASPNETSSPVVRRVNVSLNDVKQAVKSQGGAREQRRPLCLALHDPRRWNFHSLVSYAKQKCYSPSPLAPHPVVEKEEKERTTSQNFPGIGNDLIYYFPKTATETIINSLRCFSCRFFPGGLLFLFLPFLPCPSIPFAYPSTPEEVNRRSRQPQLPWSLPSAGCPPVSPPLLSPL